MTEENKKTAFANWHMSLNVDCPHCEHYFDIMESDEWLSGGSEGIEFAQRKELDLELTCPKCEKEFIVDEAEY